MLWFLISPFLEDSILLLQTLSGRIYVPPIVANIFAIYTRGYITFSSRCCLDTSSRMTVNRGPGATACILSASKKCPPFSSREKVVNMDEKKFRAEELVHQILGLKTSF